MTFYAVYADGSYSDESLLLMTPDRAVLGRLLNSKLLALDRIDANPNGVQLFGNGRLFLGVFSSLFVKKVVR